MLFEINLTDDYVDVLNRVIVGKLTTLNLGSNRITEIGYASLYEALQHPSCKLTTLKL